MNLDLNKYIPNKLTEAPGELSLGDKLQPFIRISTEWFEKWFCNLSLIAPHEEDEDGELEDVEGSIPEDDFLRKVPAYEMAVRIIVLEAYKLAVPQLDLVLTDNGFATVDSKNVVPASKARTDRLLEGLQDEIDRNIIVLLYRLRTIPEWIESKHADFYRRTLFSNPEATKYLRTPEALGTKSSWDTYLKIIPQIEELEDSLADEWFSPELMINLRKETLSGEIDGVRKSVAIKIQNQVIAYFENGDFKTRRLQEILNIIRYDSKNFPEWIGSETALAFYPPKFNNKKESTGYFF